MSTKSKPHGAQWIALKVHILINLLPWDVLMAISLEGIRRDSKATYPFLRSNNGKQLLLLNLPPKVI